MSCFSIDFYYCKKVCDCWHTKFNISTEISSVACDTFEPCGGSDAPNNMTNTDE